MSVRRDPRITKALIARAEKAGACAGALEWLRKKPRTLDDLIAHKALWAEWAVCLCPAGARRAYAAATAEARRACLAATTEPRRAYDAVMAEARRACLLTLWPKRKRVTP